MAVKGITFFKVPFDNTYRNVYTFPGSVMTTQIIYQKFYANFPHYDYVSSEKTLDFKITNGKVMLTVKGDSVARNYFNIKDYNYCALYHNVAGIPEWRFYFITSVSSLNQGPTPSTAVNLEYDCWHNNLFYIKNDKQQFTLTKGHILDVTKVGSTIRPLQISYTDSKFPVKREIIAAQPVILWLKLTLADDTLYVNKDGQIVEDTVHSAIGGDSQLPVVYFPAAVYLPTSKTFADPYSYSLIVNSINGEETTRIGKLNYFCSKSGEILQAEYTYYPPFKIIYTSSDKTFRIGTDQHKELKVYYVNQNRNTLINSAWADGNTEYSANKVVAGEVSQSGYATTIASDFTISKLVSLPSVADDAYEDVNVNLNALPQSLQMPMIYYELELMGTTVPIEVPENCSSFYVDVNIMDGNTYYRFRFMQGTVEIKRTLPVSFANNGYIQIATDQTAMFYRNQGNQLLAQEQANNRVYETKKVTAGVTAAAGFGNALLKAASGNGIGAAGSALSSGANLANSLIENEINYENKTEALEAKKADAENALSSLSTVTGNANNLILNQNYLHIVKCTVLDTVARTQILNNIYRFGPNSTVVDSINTLVHKVFNFKRYSSYEANYIPNYQERRILESILTSGVTIWNFIVDNDSTLVKNAKLAMTKSVNNPCILEA